MVPTCPIPMVSITARDLRSRNGDFHFCEKIISDEAGIPRCEAGIREIENRSA